jgi:hypothetical protein
VADEIISRDKLESALLYLAETDEEYANEKAQVERSEILRKRVRARIFLAASGTVAERERTAEVSAEAERADDDYCTSMRLYETLRAKRQRAEIVIDVFRTLEASRRKA